MRTKNMISKILKACALISMTLMLANCAKDKGNNTVATATTGTYQMINNVCYQNINGTLQQVANTSLCTTTGAGSYQMINNTCYQLVNGQYVPQVDTNLCMMNGYNNNGFNTGGIVTQVCNGQYTDGMQWVSCGTQFNCSGYTLYNQQGAIVRCQ